MEDGEGRRLDRRGFRVLRATTLAETPGSGQLRAGAAAIDLTPALGLDTAGFGFPSSRHSSGIFGRLRGTVLLLEAADGGRVLLVATDLLAGTRFLTETLAQRLGPELGIGLDRIWLCASHTHSAPGHIFGERFYDCLAARTNDFDLDLAGWLVDRLAEAAREAAGRLEPAKVGVGHAPLWGMVWQRSLLAMLANHGEPSLMGAGRKAEHARALGQALTGEQVPDGLDPAFAAVDSRITAIWAESLDGRPIGLLGLSSATPTLLPAHLALLSPDAVGVACRRVVHALHRCHGVIAPVGMAAAAMGDTNLVDPVLDIATFRQTRAEGPPLKRREDLIDLTERTGRHLAAALLRACARAREDARADLELEVRFAEFEIPGASGPSWQLPAEHQVGNAQFGGSELNNPGEPMIATWWSLLSAGVLSRLFMRWLVGEPSGRRSRWWFPVPVKLPVWGDDPHAPKNHVLYDVLRTFGRRFYGRNLRAGDAFEPNLPLRHLRLGDHELLGISVEPSQVLTARIRQALRPDAPHRVLVIGLCGGYAGYAVTQDEYRVQDYEGAATLWGRDFGVYVQAMCERVAAGPARPIGAVVPGEATFDTDPRALGSPVSLHVPPRALQLFTGQAEVVLGAWPADWPRLADAIEPDPPAGEAPPGDAQLVSLATEVLGDRDRLVLWGWWFSDPVRPSERFEPLADGWIVRLQRLGSDGWEDLRWGPCTVDDRDVSFFLRRAISADLTRVRWVASVRVPRDLLPDGTQVRLQVADRAGIRPLEGSVVKPWRWSAKGEGDLRGG